MAAVDRLRDPRSLVFRVEMDDVMSQTGFSFGAHGWDPLVATLEHWRGDPTITYPSSVLSRVYVAYRPNSVQDALFHQEREALHPLDLLPARWLGRVWTLGPRDVREARSGGLLAPSANEPLGHPYFGPRTQTEGAWHFDRTIRMFESVRRHGYRPEAFGAGHVRGYFLVDDTSWRFVITDGHHRVAALAALGIPTLEVRLWGGPSLIVGSELDRWTHDRAGPYSRDVARRLFGALLHGDSRQKATRLGLLP